MRDCGSDIHSLECAIRVTKKTTGSIPRGCGCFAECLHATRKPGLRSFARRAAVSARLPASRWIPAASTPGRGLRRRARSRPETILAYASQFDASAIYSVFPVLFGSCNQLGAYRLGLAHIGRSGERKRFRERPQVFLPVDARPLAKLQCTRLRLLDVRRAETFAVPIGPGDFDPEVQFQFGAAVVVGELVQLFKPLLKLCDPLRH